MRTPGAIDVVVAFDGRILRHHVDAFDQHIRLAECDLVGAHRLDRQKNDVETAGLECIEGFSRRIEAGELDRNAEPARKLARKVDGDAARRVGRTLRQNHIAEIDGRAQFSGRCQVFQYSGIDH